MSSLAIVVFILLPVLSSGQDQVATIEGTSDRPCFICTRKKVVEAFSSKPAGANTCVELKAPLLSECDELLTEETIRRERETRMAQVAKLKKETANTNSSATLQVRSKAREQRQLIRKFDSEILHLWDAELTVSWMEHDKASQHRKEALRLAISEATKEIVKNSLARRSHSSSIKEGDTLNALSHILKDAGAKLPATHEELGAGSSKKLPLLLGGSDSQLLPLLEV